MNNKFIKVHALFINYLEDTTEIEVKPFIFPISRILSVKKANKRDYVTFLEEEEDIDITDINNSWEAPKTCFYLSNPYTQTHNKMFCLEPIEQIETLLIS